MSSTATTTLKPTIMMNHTTVDAMDDPFADLPTLSSTEDVSSPQLVSPLEFGTGIKYLQEQQQQQQQQSTSVAPEKEADTTETTVEDDVSEGVIEDAPVTTNE